VKPKPPGSDGWVPGPMPPSVNALWRQGRGNTYRKPQYDRWQRDAGWTLKRQRLSAVEGWCAIRVFAAIEARLDGTVPAGRVLLETFDGASPQSDREGVLMTRPTHDRAETCSWPHWPRLMRAETATRYVNEKSAEASVAVT
jgi:hypothetical protein